MTLVRAAKLSPDERAKLAESFGRDVPDDQLETEAQRHGMRAVSYKALRSRWKNRGGKWADEGPRPVRADVARAIEREAAHETSGNGRRAAPAPTSTGSRSRPAPGAVLVPYLVTGGELVTTGLTALIGRYVLKVDPERIEPYLRPDQESRAQLQAAAPALAEYLDKRLGGSSEHAPVFMFLLAIGGGVLSRCLMMKATAPRLAESPPPPSPTSESPPASSTPGPDQTAESPSPAPLRLVGEVVPPGTSASPATENPP